LVAFTLSVVVTLVFTGAIVAYMKRRPAGSPHTWGEAMFGAMIVFFSMFWVYGVVPHQWLTWADNELNWRSDKLFYGPGGILKPQTHDGWNPITINYVVIRDLIAVLIYGVALAGNIALWAMWQNRGKAEAEPEPERSAFGRPLVREGVEV
jgi:hypothetical protein